ncbi:hypothetical protein AC579_2225 [Pseudocercospora musae]|uniref:Uncharacterized protein n=1 Tax=Pseudocercospora musae TaxID=113226 RepID=A0A139GTJ4_9PEZI|nr:hypothetical protein AC579_2225 [Pseudocercospora musae]
MLGLSLLLLALISAITAYSAPSKGYMGTQSKDIYYDSSKLVAHGGKSVGLDEVTAAITAASKNAKTGNLVTNLHFKELPTPTNARHYMVALG